jgi:hypothetical protein
LPGRGGVGFAHFRQADHVVHQKRWLYQRDAAVTDASLPWFSGLPWPAAGMPIDFGDELRISESASTPSIEGRVIDSANEFVFPLRSTLSNITTNKLNACKSPDAANADDLPGMSDNEYRLRRLSAYPKLGPDGLLETWMYTLRNGTKYEVRIFPLENGQKPHAPAAGNPPSIDVRVTVRRVRCNSGAGAITYLDGDVSPTTIRMVPHYQQDFESPANAISGVTDYVSRHGESRAGLDVHPEHNFHIGRTEDYTVDYTCDAGESGDPWWGEGAYWEPNRNTSSSGPADYATFVDPYGRNCPNGCLDRGDIVPWDWKPPTGAPGFERDAATEISWRMAPNLSIGESVPDFRVARYFKDTKTGGVNGVLALEDAFNPALRSGSQPQRYPPLMANSFTPLGGMLDNFRGWYNDWVTVASHPVNGDPQWECKERYAILLTDGAETCDTNGPDAAANLRSKGIRTFVIGFGAGVTADDLDGIADAGGTGSVDTDGDTLPDCLQYKTCEGAPGSIESGAGVIMTSNRDELVVALRGLFDVLQLEPTTFATGAVPSVQTEAEDTVTLTSFQPLEAASVWPGTVNQFVRPLPLKEDAEGNLKPDPTTRCEGSVETSCLAWNAGESILAQAPNAIEVLSDRMIGTGADQRRVTYTVDSSSPAVPRTTRKFDYPATADEHDLWTGLGLAFTPGDSTSESAVRTAANAIIRETLREKVAPDPRVPDDSLLITYVLGDSFHSDPRFLGGPSDFSKLASDVEGNGASCSNTSTPNRGYRCFFEKHRYRRKLLMLGSNDGQVHAFDSGVFDYEVVNRKLKGEFGVGTGRELFAHIPRPMLPHVKETATSTTRHGWGVDGTLVFDDVFVDPVHNGVPSATDREWRTLAIGGYREGGIGYYAVDLTQPDPVTTVTVANVAGVDEQVYVPISSSYVPGCNANYSASTCGPLPYPSVRWEFSDACDGTTACAQGRKDEDANGQPDLGFTWSKVNTGRVRVLSGSQTQTRYVAVFGGGFDPGHLDTVGNFVYMLDIETGTVLWKRAVNSAVASEPAAVDTDQDGLLDTIYVGTVRGLLYKVDVSAPANLDATGRVSDSGVWAPLRIFDTQGRPIFMPPTVTFIAQTGRYALGFGTGDREDLWSETLSDQGRFYMIVDTGFTAANLPAPLTETNFQVIEKESLAAAGNFLVTPPGSNHAGWVLQLDPLERVTSEAFSISGLLVFNSYTPTAGPDASEPEACVNQGFASIYSLLATNGNALGLSSRERVTAGFASSPYTASTSASGDADSGPATTDAFETAEIRAIRDSLESLFPPNCKFGAFGMRLAANLSNTAHFAIAEVPICIVSKAWKEF